jgi:hypothetical protein
MRRLLSSVFPASLLVASIGAFAGYVTLRGRAVRVHHESPCASGEMDTSHSISRSLDHWCWCLDATPVILKHL